MTKISLLLTGSELMSGDTIDTNSSMIAKQFEAHQWKIYKKVTIGDDFDLILDEIQRLSLISDILIVNGGLGPTQDDLTAEVISKLINKPLEKNKLAYSHVKLWCEKKNITLNESNLKQVYLPNSVEVLPNEIGSAVGFFIEFNDCMIFCTPGVPRELKPMLVNSILPKIQSKLGKQGEIKITRFLTFGIGESKIQNKLNPYLSELESGINLGFRASMPFVEIKLIRNSKECQQNFHTFKNRIQSLFNESIVGKDEDTFSCILQYLLKQQNKTMVTAESCTGGFISSLLVQESGASTFLKGGYVSYSNQMKMDMLGINQNTLEKYGAVSKQTVLEMAKGALQNSKADYSIAVSGIAGPTGETTEKPVGTVWIAWGTLEEMYTKCLLISGNRELFIKRVAYAGLDLLRRMLLKYSIDPIYSFDKLHENTQKHSFLLDRK